MKYLIITGIFVLGLSMGYVVGTQSPADTASGNLIAEQQSEFSTTENDEEKISSNRPVAETNLDSVNFDSDTLSFIEDDSIMIEFMTVDTLENGDDDDLSISREKMIKAVRLPIVYLSEEEAKDTALQDALGIENVQAKTMFVEFWESPLNFEGYKLSKKKMIVYGLSPQFDFKIYKKESIYYFAYHNLYYKMKETQDFLPFVEVSKSEVFND